MTASTRQRLHPEVLALFEAGKLHGFDCEWISRLRTEAQLAAAKKCTASNFFCTLEERRFRGKGTMLL